MHSRIKSEIVALAQANPTEEVCGFIYHDVAGIPHVLPCRNVAANRTEEFEIDDDLHPIDDPEPRVEPAQLDYLRAEVQALRAALVLIANARTPCRQCGDAHAYRPVPDGGGAWTWAHPADGHTYQRMSPVEVARQTLSTTGHPESGSTERAT